MEKEGLVKIESIKVVIGTREIVLNPDEARKLRDELQNLLGPTQHAIIWPPIQDWTYEKYPIWVDPNSEPFPDKWVVTCGPLGQSASLTIYAQ